MKCIVVLMFWLVGSVQGQTDFELIEQEILESYRILKVAHLEQNSERQRIFSAKLKNQLMFALLQKGSYYYPFLYLQKYIKVVESPDKRVRIFNWDALSLNSWRSACSVVQFRGVQNESYFQVLSEGKQLPEDYKDIFVEKIYPLIHPSGNSYYLFLGRGSHGKGEEHITARIFYLGHNELIECQDCFEGNLPSWTVKGSTQYPVDLQYDFHRQKLYYYQPTYNSKTGVREKGLHYQLYWKDGFFRSY